MTHLEMKTTSNSDFKGHGLFPARLFEMLDRVDSEGMSNLISWDESGKQVIVKKRQALEASGLLQKYMRQNKYTSFNRQLQYYGFKRVDSGPTKNTQTIPIFMHAKFQRDHPDLHKDMETLRPPSNKNKSCPSPCIENKKRKMDEEPQEPNSKKVKKTKKAKRSKPSNRKRRQKCSSKKSGRTFSCTSPVSVSANYFDVVSGFDLGFLDDDTKSDRICNDVLKANEQNCNKHTPDPVSSESFVKKEEEEYCHPFNYVQEVEVEEDNSYNYLLQAPLPQHGDDHNDCYDMLVESTEHIVPQDHLYPQEERDTDCTAITQECQYQTTKFENDEWQPLNINVENTHGGNVPNTISEWYDMDDSLETNSVQSVYWS